MKWGIIQQWDITRVLMCAAYATCIRNAFGYRALRRHGSRLITRRLVMGWRTMKYFKRMLNWRSLGLLWCRRCLLIAAFIRVCLLPVNHYRHFRRVVRRCSRTALSCLWRPTCFAASQGRQVFTFIGKLLLYWSILLLSISIVSECWAYLLSLHLLVNIILWTVSFRMLGLLLLVTW